MNMGNFTIASDYSVPNRTLELQKQISELRRAAAGIRSDNGLDERTRNMQDSILQSQITRLCAQLSMARQEQASGMEAYKNNLAGYRQPAQETPGNEAKGLLGLGRHIDLHG